MDLTTTILNLLTKVLQAPSIPVWIAIVVIVFLVQLALASRDNRKRLAAAREAHQAMVARQAAEARRRSILLRGIDDGKFDRCLLDLPSLRPREER